MLSRLEVDNNGVFNFINFFLSNEFEISSLPIYLSLFGSSSKPTPISHIRLILVDCLESDSGAVQVKLKNNGSIGVTSLPSLSSKSGINGGI